LVRAQSARGGRRGGQRLASNTKATRPRTAILKGGGSQGSLMGDQRFTAKVKEQPSKKKTGETDRAVKKAGKGQGKHNGERLQPY